MSDTEENDTLPLLPAKPVRLNYTKRYDQVSWHSADTDFEPDPSASSADERRKKLKKPVYSKRRKQKLAALIIVVVIFLSVMCGLIYVYLRRTEEFIQLPCGKLSGVKESVSLVNLEKEYILYKGIPYAKPPVADLRWRPPVLLNENCWDGIFHADKYAIPCVGGFNDSFYGSEDCLYLDVFTPVENGDKLLPVIVYFGSEIFSANQKKPRENNPPLEFVAHMEVVLVNVNFRTDSLGFLSSKEVFNLTQSYGNVGLLDQINALKWVQKNIATFGGNHNSITTMGKTSIYALLSSPQAKGLFHKAFSFDPSPNLKATYKEAFLQNEKMFASCQSSNKLSACLGNISAKALQQSLHANYDGSRWELPFQESLDKLLLVLEPNVFPHGPEKLSQMNQTIDIPVLIGHTAQASGLMSASHPNSTQQLQRLITEKLKSIDQNLPEDVIRLYINESSYNRSPQVIYDSITSDMRLICPTNSLLKEMRKSRHHVFYQYILMSEERSNEEVVHGRDISTLFTMDRNHPSFNVGERLRKNFKHFLLYGHPDEFGWDSDKLGTFRTDGRFEVSATGFHSKHCDSLKKYDKKLAFFSWIN